MEKVVRWDDVNSDMRLNRLGWFSTRSDDQIIDDAMEMVDALETIATTTNVTEMGDNIIMDMVELCMALLRNKNNGTEL